MIKTYIYAFNGFEYGVSKIDDLPSGIVKMLSETTATGFYKATSLKKETYVVYSNRKKILIPVLARAVDRYWLTTTNMNLIEAYNSILEDNVIVVYKNDYKDKFKKQFMDELEIFFTITNTLGAW